MIRRTFFATAASGMAWLLGVKAETPTTHADYEPCGGVDLGKQSDVTSVTYLGSDGVSRRAVRSELAPHIWWVFVDYKQEPA